MATAVRVLVAAIVAILLPSDVSHVPVPARPAVETSVPGGATARAPDAPERVSPRIRTARRYLRGAIGLASYYAHEFEGRLTASGIRFNPYSMVAAHPTYPFGTIVRVTNLRNGRSVLVRIVDRGPARGPRHDGVIIDLSRRAAEALQFVRAGRTRVRLDVLSRGNSRAYGTTD